MTNKEKVKDLIPTLSLEDLYEIGSYLRQRTADVESREARLNRKS